MVIDDFDRREAARPPAVDKKNETVNAENFTTATNLQLVSPIDHLAAWVADFILFVPLVTFILAPLRKEIAIAQIANDVQSLLILATVGFAMALTSLVAYQTVFIALWGATPGKAILKLTVSPAFGQGRVSWGAAFLRATFWCLGLVTFGITWLGIFSDARRRAFHDRIADTQLVVTDSRRGARTPTTFEASTVAGFRAAGLLFALIFSVHFLHGFLQKQEVINALFEQEPVGSQLCESVSTALQGWMGEKNPKRIDVALALHAADRLEDSCLEAEADQNFLLNADLESTYTAKAIVHQDDEKLFKKYQTKICSSFPDGHGCKLLGWIKAKASGSDSDQDSGDAHEFVVAADDSAFMKIWALKINMERRQYAAALTLLAEPAPDLELAFYFASTRLKVLRDLNQTSRAQTEFTAALDGLNREERMDLTKETCLAETELNCASERPACERLQKTALSDKPVALDGLETSLALVRHASCAANPSEALTQLEEVLSPTVQTYADALKLKFKENRKQSDLALKKIIFNADGSALALEALSTFLEKANRPEQMRAAMATWQDADEDQVGWRHLGWQITQNFLRSDHPLQALESGLRLKNAGFIPFELQKTLVVAAFKSGNIDSAQALLAAYSGPSPKFATEPDATNLRRPASDLSGDSDFEKISQVLLQLRTAEAQAGEAKIGEAAR